MNKILLFIIPLIFFRISEANEIRTSTIIQNCNVCHTEKYKKENKNGVMNRILDPINILDIIEMADYLYGE